MKLPRAEDALIPIEKVRDYLLSAANPRTRGKAAFFQGLGFDPAAWELLRDALLLIAQAEEVSPGQARSVLRLLDQLDVGRSFAPCGSSTLAKTDLASSRRFQTDDP